MQCMQALLTMCCKLTQFCGYTIKILIMCSRLHSPAILFFYYGEKLEENSAEMYHQHVGHNVGKTVKVRMLGLLGILGALKRSCGTPNAHAPF